MNGHCRSTRYRIRLTCYPHTLNAFLNHFFKKNELAVDTATIRCKTPSIAKNIFFQWSLKMAKPTTIKIRLNSTADTGHFYVTKKNARTMTEKMVLKKYDPVARKHVEYKEGKIK